MTKSNKNNEESPNNGYDIKYLNNKGKFKKGNPGGGRPKESKEKKEMRKARKQIIEEYKQALTEALPFIEPVIVAKAMEGDVSAIKEIHDRTMDKSKQATEITNPDGNLKTIIINKNVTSDD